MQQEPTDSPIPVEDPSMPSPSPVAAALDSASFLEGKTCAQHPEVAAVAICSQCGAAVCGTCDFSFSDKHLCPGCIKAVPPPPWEGKTCMQHPGQAAVAICNRCGVAVCGTCDFAFPDEHVCPACVTGSRNPVSPKKKQMMVWSVVCAVLSTVSFVVFLIVAAVLFGDQGNETDPALAKVVGFIGMFFVLGFSISGFCSGIEARNRYGRTPLWAWVGIAWSALIGALFVLMSIIGCITK